MTSSSSPIARNRSSFGSSLRYCDNSCCIRLARPVLQMPCHLSLARTTRPRCTTMHYNSAVAPPLARFTMAGAREERCPINHPAQFRHEGSPAGRRQSARPLHQLAFSLSPRGLAGQGSQTPGKAPLTPAAAGVTPGGMKSLPLIFLLAVAGCDDKPYDFHPALQGAAMWRCNRRTGAVDFCTVNDQQWHPIRSGPTVAQVLQSLQSQVNEAGGAAPAKTFNFEDASPPSSSRRSTKSPYE